MYRCGICTELSRRGQVLLRHNVYKPSGQIKREIPVCPSCKSSLEDGATVEALIRFKRPKVVSATPGLANEARVAGVLQLGRDVTEKRVNTG